jgi:nucleoside 2-deoxyribosyltransferase
MKVYLAGDMKSGWQDRFAEQVPKWVELIDPRSHGLPDPAQYTAWDLDGVRRADAVIAYMGAHNPSGFGLCIEAGYAYGLGKRIIFVDEMTVDWRGRYFDMLRQIATVVPTLPDAARALLYAPTTQEA